MPDPVHPTPAGHEIQDRERAHRSALLALSLAELLRARASIPDALSAIAARHTHDRSPRAPDYERLARAVRDEGRSVFEAVRTERHLFTSRFVAVLALANLGGPLFRTFLGRLREYALEFQALPPDAAVDFPIMTDEIREFCFLFGHVTVERASQPEVQHWLPRVFTQPLRLPVTHLLARFFDQGMLLSQACARTPPFNDPEMILALRAGEETNRVGQELLALADWLVARRALDERLRWTDAVGRPNLAKAAPAGTDPASPP